MIEDVAAPRVSDARALARGFTLMELAIVLAISGLVLMVASMLFVTYTTIIRRARDEVLLAGKTRVGIDYVFDEIKRTGRVNDAGVLAILEDNCGARGGDTGFPDCEGTDRLTLIQPVSGYATCTAETETTPGVVRIGLVTPAPTEADPTPSARCCFATADFVRQVVFRGPTGAVLPALLASTGSTPSTCEFTYRSLNGAAAVADNSEVMISDVKTFFVEFPRGPRLPGRLVMHTELDGDVTSILSERLPIVDGVVDFQVARHSPAAGGGEVERRIRIELQLAKANAARGTLAAPTMPLGRGVTLDTPHLFFNAGCEAAVREGG